MSTDKIHPVGQGKDWNESFYFNLYDRTNDLFMFIRVGLLPNADERSAFCFIMMPDGSTVWAWESDPLREGGTAVRGLRLERVEADKRWKLMYDGHMDNMAEEGIQKIPVSFSMEFETLNQVFDYRDSLGPDPASLFGGTVTDHVEQFGRARGSLMVDGRQYDISGLGERAHTWGRRGHETPGMMIWLSAQFSKDLALNLTKLIGPEERSAGFFHANGRNVALVKAEVRTVLDPDGSPSSIAVSATDVDGGKHRFTGEVLRVVMLPLPSRDGKRVAAIHEALMEFTFNSQKGYGMIEYLVHRN